MTRVWIIGKNYLIDGFFLSDKSAAIIPSVDRIKAVESQEPLSAYKLYFGLFMSIKNKSELSVM